jgi:1,4-dihydroxy-2-naphthoate octaprenyltransferase
LKNPVVRFLHFVEIQTKIASVTPFCTGLSYALYVHKKINRKSTAVFFIAMLLFDMAATAINNYIDARASKSRVHFSDALSLGIIVFFTALSAVLGLYLTWLHGIPVLAAGVICFAAGIFYTYGPAPISRTPYGELISGGIMGFFIPFLAFFINAPENTFIEIESLFPVMSLRVNVITAAKLGFVSLPPACCIANIMLANNICDVERDVKLSRFTLPYYIGREKALRLFAFLYYAAYSTILVLSVLQIIPLFCLLSLLSFIPVRRNIRRFRMKQIKSETFPLSGVNMLWMGAPYFLLMFFGSFEELDFTPLGRHC